MINGRSLLVTLFLAAPVSVMPLLTLSDRLDLIDLFEARMPAQVTNRFGGKTEMTMLSDSLITLRMTEATKLELRLQTDSTIEMSKIIELPDKKLRTVKVFSTNWEKIR